MLIHARVEIDNNDCQEQFTPLPVLFPLFVGTMELLSITFHARLYDGPNLESPISELACPLIAGSDFINRFVSSSIRLEPYYSDTIPGFFQAKGRYPIHAQSNFAQIYLHGANGLHNYPHDIAHFHDSVIHTAFGLYTAEFDVFNPPVLPSSVARAVHGYLSDVWLNISTASDLEGFNYIQDLSEALLAIPYASARHIPVPADLIRAPHLVVKEVSSGIPIGLVLRLPLLDVLNALESQGRVAPAVAHSVTTSLGSRAYTLIISASSVRDLVPFAELLPKETSPSPNVWPPLLGGMDLSYDALNQGTISMHLFLLPKPGRENVNWRVLMTYPSIANAWGWDLEQPLVNQLVRAGDIEAVAEDYDLIVVFKPSDPGV